MLDIHRPSSSPDTKIYFTHIILPTYIDPLNISTKKQPFATINKQPFTHTLDLVLPAEIYTLVSAHLDALATRKYARVHLKLSEILAAEFLNTYIKNGNVAMLSEGRALVDNRFEIYNGVLKMELDRQTYERCGLQGAPIEDGGKKHQKQRWVVSYDLRAPSMVHGKKGFGRLEWACRNVLDKSLTWLFWNEIPGSSEALSEGREVISAHAPWVCDVEKSVLRLEGVCAPGIDTGRLGELYGEEEALEVLEWLHLLGLDSPRVRDGDAINPHLCRYDVPDLGSGTSKTDFVRVRWRGLMTPAFIREIFLAARGDKFMKKTKPNSEPDMDVDGPAEKDRWFAMSAQGFGGRNTWTLMQFDTRDTLTWETER